MHDFNPEILPEKNMKFSFFMMPLHLPSENPSLAFDRDIDLINYAEELVFDELRSA